MQAMAFESMEKRNRGVRRATTTTLTAARPVKALQEQV